MTKFTVYYVVKTFKEVGDLKTVLGVEIIDRSKKMIEAVKER